MNQSIIDYQSLRKVNLFSHIDFMNRWFHGLLDPKRIGDKRGSVLTDSEGERFVFRYAKFYNFRTVENGKTLPVVYKESSGDFWILHPAWITRTAPLRSDPEFRPETYDEVLDRSSLHRASGAVMRNLIEKSRIVELNK